MYVYMSLGIVSLQSSISDSRKMAPLGFPFRGNRHFSFALLAPARMT